MIDTYCAIGICILSHLDSSAYPAIAQNFVLFQQHEMIHRDVLIASSHILIQERTLSVHRIEFGVDCMK